MQFCAPRGDVCVLWLDAGLDLWVAGEELRVLAAGRHVVSLWRRDQQGRRSLRGRRFAALPHDGTVELLPRRIIRAVQDSGLCWTFMFNPITHEVDPPWIKAPSAAAEALVAADLAMEQVLLERQAIDALGLVLDTILHPGHLKSIYHAIEKGRR